jgi:RNA polymerase sigma-70 factor (ECF subfamily)
MTIARNHVINHWRDRKDHVDVDEVAFFIEGEDGRETEVINDDVRGLHKAMEKLPPKDKRLVEMKYLLGYRYKDMGEELNKSAGAVRVETHRAMKKLKKLLDPSYEEA